MRKTRVLVFMSLFIAMNIVLVRFFKFQPLPTVRIDFGFIPLMFSSMMFGPVIGGLTGAVADLIGATLFPSGPYFPGFTISGFVSGVIFGLFLYKKPNKLFYIIAAALVNILIVDVVLNTVWLEMLYHKGVYVILPARLIKSALMLPIEVAVIYVSRKYLKSFLEGEVTTPRNA